jgi:hypothetical protein
LQGWPNSLANTYLWDILYGILTVEKYLIRLDWRASRESIGWAVNNLLGKRGIPQMYVSDFQAETCIHGGETLNRIAEMLKKQDLILAFIDDGSDSFPLILADKNDFNEISDIAAELELEIKTYFV